MNNLNNCIGVSELNGYIKMMMDRDDFLSSITLRGEISNFKRNASGHFYFSLKDDNAAISAVMFRSAAANISFLPSDGMKVVVYGRVSVFEKSGQYQIYVQTMIADGIGELARAYEALKRKLEAEGLFAPERKKPLPALPRRVGIVTSPTGAAIRDMLSVSKRRYPLSDVVIFPAAVQGGEAPALLRMGVDYFNATQSVDVIIIGRGGGSIEDLWAFNDEALTRAVAASDIPIISAVGHETDFVLCDFAADLRAPTPSAAAELAFPDKYSLISRLEKTEQKYTSVMLSRIENMRKETDALDKLISLNSPIKRLENSKLELMGLEVKIASLVDKIYAKKKSELSEISARLDSTNPLSVLSRGYGAVECGGRIVSSTKDIGVGDRIGIMMADGKISATVDAVTPAPRKRAAKKTAKERSDSPKT